jgi:hypothetical protein
MSEFPEARVERVGRMERSFNFQGPIREEQVLAVRTGLPYKEELYG